MNHFMRLLLLTIFTAILSVSFVGCSRSYKEGSNYQHVSDDDAAMNSAIEKAKASSDDFVKAFHAQKPGTREFFVKKPYPTPSGEAEHMWIEITEEHNGVLKGVVANEAEETHEVKRGQAVFLKILEISDWKYVDGKKLVGGYTIRFFLRQNVTERKRRFYQGGWI
jgi:uncharacterized protein YegJ (DUF2314 family)